VFINSQATVTPNDPDQYFHAITFVTNTQFQANADGLVSNVSERATRTTTTSALTDVSMSFNSTNGGELGTGGSPTGTIVFPAGLTIYGRWSQVKLQSGQCVAYLES
jgi:hypothetical protein